MNRRSYMVAFGASLLAGCSSSPGTNAPEPERTATQSISPTETPAPEPTPSPVPTATGTPTPNAQFADEVLTDVVAELDIAIAELHFTTKDIDHIDQVPDIETREPMISVEMARASLSEAERWANAEQREAIAALRTVTNQIESAVGVVESTFDIHDTWVLALSYYRSGRFERASSEFDEQQTPIEDATAQLADIHSELIKAEPSLGSDYRPNVDDFRTFLDNLTAVLNGFEILMTGGSPLSRGEAEMELGLEAITHDDPDDDDYPEGVDRFEAAIAHLAEAEAIFRAGEEREDVTFRPTIVESTCDAARLKAASEEYLTAAEEAIRGHVEDAIDALERGHEERARVCG